MLTIYRVGLSTQLRAIAGWVFATQTKGKQDDLVRTNQHESVYGIGCWLRASNAGLFVIKRVHLIDASVSCKSVDAFRNSRCRCRKWVCNFGGVSLREFGRAYTNEDFGNSSIGKRDLQLYMPNSLRI